MNKIKAEENIQMIREIMERSARYTSFSGLSGILAGVFALIGCAATVKVYLNVPTAEQDKWYYIIWVSVLVLAIAQDLLLAQRKARRNGQTIFVPATFQAIRALLPGVFVAIVLSIRALTLRELDAIPAIWTLGYGAALCAAGRFTVKELRIFGVVQLITGAFGLFLMSYPPYSLYLLAISFGLYHILYGLWMTRKYGW